MTGVHLCASDLQGSAVGSNESKGRTDLLAPPIGALLIEACDAAAAETAAAAAVLQLGLDERALVPGVYRLEYMRLKPGD